MRIVSGRFGGRIIKAPSGLNTRPTTDRVREAMISSLISAYRHELQGCEVLDMFAGSGALGLELLSRGAAHATFIEKNRSTARVVQENIQTLRLSRSEAKVVVQDAFVWAKRMSSMPVEQLRPYHIVMLDPPYALDVHLVMQLIDTLVRSDILADDALVLYEHAKDSLGIVDLLDQDPHARLEAVKAKKMGSVAYDIVEVKRV